MYVPSQPGRPGTLIFSKTATRAEVAEEMLHLKQHKSLKFAQLTTAQIIALEIEAQTELMAFARRNGNDADAAVFEENLAYWQKQKTQLELGGDAAKVVEAEVSGFKMADVPTPTIKRFGKVQPNVNLVEIEISKLNKIHPAPKLGKEGELIKIEEFLLKEGFDLGEAIPVIKLPDGAILVADGHHRLLVMEKLGQKTIPCDLMTVSDAIRWYGIETFATLVEIGKQSGYYKGTYVAATGIVQKYAMDAARKFLDKHFPIK